MLVLQSPEFKYHVIFSPQIYFESEKAPEEIIRSFRVGKIYGLHTGQYISEFKEWLTEIKP